MPGFTESKITLNFPDNNYFRLGECHGYKVIQHCFGEMDACWYDQEKDILYLIELKDWGNNRLDEENDPNYTEEQISDLKNRITNHRIKNLLKKSVDTTCTFMSVLLARKHGLEIQKCSPFSISKDTIIKLICIINFDNVDNTYISTINTKYKTYFSSYAKLFNVKAFAVLPKHKASEMFSWVL